MTGILYHHHRFGITRAAVYEGGLPQVYTEGPEIDPRLNLVGVRSVARLKARSGGVSFITLADGAEAVLDVAQNIRAPALGAALEVEIIAEARRDKLARANLIAEANGEPRRLSAVKPVKEALRARFPQARLVEGDDALDPLDAAEHEAIFPSGPMRGGGYLSVEPTRALIACDVDAGADGDSVAVSPKQWSQQCNARAIYEVARRLRLSNLAGLVVVDLIGRRHDPDRVRALSLAAFGDEAARMMFAGVTKFGTLEFVRPWGSAPHYDQAYDERNRLRPDKAARLLLRQAVQAARNDAGGVLHISAPGMVIDAGQAYIRGSMDPLMPRLVWSRDDKAPPEGLITFI